MLTDKELLEIFPEAKEIIPVKIREWQKERETIIEVIKNNLRFIQNKVKDEFSRWFYRELVKWCYDGQELLKVDRHLARLKRMQLFGTVQNSMKEYEK